MSQTPTHKPAQNVLGQRLDLCCSSPRTGFYRDGFCHTGPQDFGSHTVCAQVTEEFLAYTKQRGNDLSTPVGAYQFPGLKPGDRWCLCASRWQEAISAGVAPPIVLAATHENVLETIPLEILQEYALDSGS
ncbi:DUF2237 domain-containing protein [Geitlerinema sp. P-1104]|uniref:DUF2237 family protein n=1 Tax=Geitlerinema sp. P-1104 TaxID=2546230 RepID=UPI0014776F50|nr:DUF2237 domain-containing protein [Geitlerinema sp. P-1104]NMG58564.1 DUF2237 domain-containing protein [Geitlerinema sp. P-1104]